MAIPPFEVEFDKAGNAVDPHQIDAAIAGIAAAGATDVLVLSHGWNNDIADARDLYSRLLARIEAQLAAAPGRHFAALEIFWPSKKFTDPQLIPGGAAALNDGTLDAAAVKARLDDLKSVPERLGREVVDPARSQVLEQAKAEVDALEQDAGAQRRFVELLRSLVPRDAAHVDDASEEFFSVDPVDLLRSLAGPVPPPLGPAPGGGGGAAMVEGGGGAARDQGGAAGLGDFFQGVKAAANRLLNFLTYYEMKRRAGLVGASGVAAALRRVHQRFPAVKLHLAGHSFGGRLVTAAVDAIGPAVRPATLTLLQAAYSHNGLAPLFDGRNDGFFRAVLSPAPKVSGPILITNTKNDLAVGIGYPLASRLSRDVASALGDRDDPYGGMGRNGAQHTPEVDPAVGFLDAVGTRYRFAAGKVYNLNSDDFISGHSDIAKDEVAFAMLTAIAST